MNHKRSIIQRKKIITYAHLILNVLSNQNIRHKDFRISFRQIWSSRWKQIFLQKQPPDVYKKTSKKFRNIHRKTPVLESYFNKIAGLKACNFIKKKLQHSCFPVNIAKLKNIFFEEHLQTAASVSPITFSNRLSVGFRLMHKYSI